jgi:hypothetical protein
VTLSTSNSRHQPMSKDRESSVGTATGYGRGSTPGRVRIFLFSVLPRPALRSTQPPIQWVPGTIFLGVKRPGREVDHSPPSSADVRNDGVILPLPGISSWHSA